MNLGTILLVAGGLYMLYRSRKLGHGEGSPTLLRASGDIQKVGAVKEVSPTLVPDQPKVKVPVGSID
jgi:hypothetical protein